MFAVIGVPIWAMLFVLLKQMHRVASETLETAELMRARDAGADASLFELDDEALLLEQNRFRWMLRWMMPSVTVLLAVFLLGSHLFDWGWTFANAFDEEVIKLTREPLLVMWFAVGIGFLCFLFARYSLAMARILPEWRPINAGAVCMAGNALICLALCLALAFSETTGWTEPVLAYILRVLLIVLGLELLVNLILDFYRPIQPGQVPRPSFDSRLLAMVSAPGSIAKSIAEAINYQFGFEVSSTWFYQLLQRWLLPIITATACVVWLTTSIVVVHAEERVVIERFGRELDTEGGEGLGPGIYFKLPYPIDITYRAPVNRVSELVIGETKEEKEEGYEVPLLWSKKHEFVPELMLLVASEQLTPSGEHLTDGKSEADLIAESVAVSLLKVSVPIEYRIKKNPHDYLYKYEEPERLLEAIAYRYLSDYAASVDIDELMGPGRDAFNKRLREIIQTKLDEYEAGIKIVYAGVRGAHPPAEGKVASAFQAVITARIAKESLINAAEGRALRILTEVAGSEARAVALDEAILEADRLRSEKNVDAAAVAAAAKRVDELLMGNPAKGISPLSGKAAAEIAGERAISSVRIADAAAKVRGFAPEVAAFEAAPQLYKQRKLLEIFEGLDHVRKYLLVGDPSNVLVVYETAQEGGLDSVLTKGIEDENKARGNQ